MHTTRRLRSNLQQRGGYLVLQLHDELLYEVSTIDFLCIYRECKLFGFYGVLQDDINAR